MHSEIKTLVQAMHDSLCQCGGWCPGAEGDYLEFTFWVEEYWGSLYALENYLRTVRDASTDHK